MNKEDIWNAFKLFVSLLAIVIFIFIIIYFNITRNDIGDLRDRDRVKEYINLVEIDRYKNNVVYYDLNTGIMYYVYNEDKNYSWCTPIYGTDGLPKLYERGDIDYAEKRNELQSGDRRLDQ